MSESTNRICEGRVAIVTGAGRGIGREHALMLAEQGARVIVNDLGGDEAGGGADLTPAQEVVAEIEAMGGEAAVNGGNVADFTAAGAMVEQAVDTWGRLDILISNPAYSRRADFLDYDPEVFEKVLKGTLFGGFHMSQLVARHMVERGGGGKIVFIASVHARIPYTRSVAYNAGKSGLVHMAATIANELLKHRINVNVIEPGWIDTPLIVTTARSAEKLS